MNVYDVMALYNGYGGQKKKKKTEADLRQSFSQSSACLACTQPWVQSPALLESCSAYNSSTDETEVRRSETQDQLSLQSEL